MGESAEIFERLSRIEQAVARIDERTRAHADYEERIRELERAEDKRRGVLAALSLFSSVVGAALVWLFRAIFGGGQ